MAEEKRGRGKPRKFETAQQLMDAYKEYIDYCIENDRFPNIAGFCAYHNITRDTFYMCKEYYPDTYNIVNDKLEDEVLQFNDYRAQLYLKNKFGYRDRQETANVNYDAKSYEDFVDKVKGEEY